MIEIVENLFLGDLQDVPKAVGICDSIISIINQPVDQSDYKNSLHISVEDSPVTDILSKLPEIIEFIKKNLDNNSKILVHCFAGSSRSVSAIIAYLLNIKQIASVDEGLDLIVNKGRVHILMYLLNKDRI
jgi:protein tyrosine phosphatase